MKRPCTEHPDFSDAHALAQATLRVARVLDVDPPWFTLDASPRAQRAPSCHLIPRVGDLVLICSTTPGNPAVIVAVLESRASTPAVLMLPGHPTLEAPEGTLRLQAQSIHVAAREGLHLEATRLKARAGSLTCMAGAILITSGRIKARALQWMVLGRECIRRILWKDDTWAGNIRLEADRSLHLQGQRSKLLGRSHVGIDAERIDLG